MSTYVISDIHGCFNEFLRMLEIIGFTDHDSLYLAGDYVDRGTQSFEMLTWIEQSRNNVYPIKGNHDAEFVENILLMEKLDRTEELMTDMDSSDDAMALYDSVKYTLGKKNPTAEKYFDYYGTIKALICERGVTLGIFLKWAKVLDKFPLFYRFKVKDRECIVVHAGYIEKLNGLVSNYDSIEDFYMYAREDGIYQGGIPHGLIIAGHTPTIAKQYFAYNDGNVYRYYDNAKDCIFYDIDCGCAYYSVAPSATLACLRLEDEEVFYL